MKKIWLVILVFVVVLSFAAPSRAEKAQQFSDPVEQGRYLTNIGGCIGCHTPYKNPATLEIDETRLFAGGNPFPLGPAGIVYTSNLTSDEATGLGSWTDEEIKNAIRLGLKRDGTQLHPIMPYFTYNNMAESDVDAIVAYLRTLPAINNEVPPRQVTMPPLPPLEVQSVTAPPSSDATTRGTYLVRAVMACNDCHTPLDPETGQPVMEKYLAGGQPYEGPWGVVYGANITPHEATGIGRWTDEQIGRAIREGVRIDGRRLILMPWREYKELTDEDLAAVIYFLRNNVPPVENKVPAVSLAPGLLEVVSVPEENGSSLNVPVIGGVVVVLLALVVVLMTRRRRRAG